MTGLAALDIMSQLKTITEGRMNDRFISSAYRQEFEAIDELLPFETIIITKMGDNEKKTSSTSMKIIVNKFYGDC